MMSINLVADDDYMSNMDLPPSSSDEEEGREGEVSNQTDGHAQPDAAQPDDALSSKSKSLPQKLASGVKSSPIPTAEEGCLSSEAHHSLDDQWLSAQQKSSEPIAQADDAPTHSLHGNCFDAGQVQDGSNSAQSFRTRSLETSMEHFHLT